MSTIAITGYSVGSKKISLNGVHTADPTKFFGVSISYRYIDDKLRAIARVQNSGGRFQAAEVREVDEGGGGVVTGHGLISSDQIFVIHENEPGSDLNGVHKVQIVTPMVFDFIGPRYRDLLTPRLLYQVIAHSQMFDVREKRPDTWQAEILLPRSGRFEFQPRLYHAGRPSIVYGDTVEYDIA